MRVGWYIVEGDGLEAPLSFKMTQWSCYCIVLYCIVLYCIVLHCIVLENVFVIGWSMVGERKFCGHVMTN